MAEKIQQWVVFAGFIFILTFLGPFTSSGVASQQAEVLSQDTILFRDPIASSEKLTTLQKGVKIYSSYGMVRDSWGTYWYKVKTEAGVVGYVSANDINTTEIKSSLHNAGIGKLVDEEDPGSLPWNFLIRAMALGGLEAYSLRREIAAEGEITVCVPFMPHGYLHRLLSVGAAYFLLSSDYVLAASAVVRVYGESRIEPEFRFRVGENLSQGVFVGGFNAGINYPFSLYYGTHVSGYLELGSLAYLTGPTALHIWGAMGLGLHF